jgi:hypothetical protein
MYGLHEAGASGLSRHLQGARRAQAMHRHLDEASDPRRPGGSAKLAAHFKAAREEGVMKMFAVPMFRCSIVAVPLLLLAACGGGGGGGGDSPPAAQVSALVITSANAQPVAAQAVETTSGAGPAQAGASVITGVQVDAGAAAPGPQALAAAGRMLLGNVPARTNLLTGATTTQTRACPISGSITVTENSQSSTSATAGDSVALTANECTANVQGVVTRMNGAMTITITSGSYNENGPYPRNVGMRIAASNFSMTQGGVTSSSNGDLEISLLQTSSTVTSVTLNSTALSNTITTSTGSHTVTLRNYFQKVDANSSGAIVQSVATVETNHSRFGGGTVRFEVSTQTPLQVNSSGALVSGSVKASGTSSGLLLSVSSTDTFNLQLDTNGDGAYESSSTVTRSQLRSQL